MGRFSFQRQRRLLVSVARSASPKQISPAEESQDKNAAAELINEPGLMDNSMLQVQH
jgi:hypothetical protein